MFYRLWQSGNEPVRLIDDYFKFHVYSATRYTDLQCREHERYGNSKYVLFKFEVNND